MSALYHCGHILIIITLLSLLAYQSFGTFVFIKFYHLIELCHNNWIQGYMISSLLFMVMRFFIFRRHIVLFKRHRNFNSNITMLIIQFICEAFLSCYGLYQTGYIDKYCLHTDNKFGNLVLDKTPLYLFLQISTFINFCLAIIIISLSLLICCVNYLQGNQKRQNHFTQLEERQNLLQYSNQDKDVI